MKIVRSAFSSLIEADNDDSGFFCCRRSKKASHPICRPDSGIAVTHRAYEALTSSVSCDAPIGSATDRAFNSGENWKRVANCPERWARDVSLGHLIPFTCKSCAHQEIIRRGEEKRLAAFV